MGQLLILFQAPLLGNLAVGGGEVWVAKGTYYTTDSADREISFQLKSGVVLYGGFAGTESALDQRDWETNVTILSGDIGKPDDNSDNSYHVVVGADNAIIDGFTITGGFADNFNNTGNLSKNGAGFYVDQANPLISNCMIRNNYAIGYGAGIYAYYGQPRIVNCVFNGNDVSQSRYTTGGYVSGYGGGIAALFSHPEIINCTLVNNRADDFGGGIYTNASGLTTVANSIFWNNTAPTGKELYLGTYGTTVTIGFSDVEGGQSSVFVDPSATLVWGTGMIDADPLFVEAAYDDYHLTSPSPCADTGNAISPNLPPEDFEGDPRVAGNAPDIGADEYHMHLYVTVFTPAGGGVVPGATGAVKVIGPPNEPVLVVMGRSVRNPPLQTKYGLFYLVPHYFWIAQGTIPADGVAVFNRTAPSYWKTGHDHPFQAFVGQLGSSTARFTNLMMLEVE